MLTVGSLFSGIGGFDLGFERAGMQIKWQVEIDKYCQQVLAKHWPGVKRYGDIREVHGILSHANKRGLQESRAEQQADRAGQLHEVISNSSGKQIVGENEGGFQPTSSRDSGGNEIAPCPSCLEPVDLICGGFPCQPFSHAGKRKGKDDDRHLWPQYLRIIQELKPRWVVGENVPGIISLELDNIISDLEGEGYSVGTLIIPACAVDAQHRRDRIWIVAYADVAMQGINARTISETQRNIWRGTESDLSSGCGEVLADSYGTRLSEPTCRQIRCISEEAGASEGCEFGRRNAAKGRNWSTEPNVGRVAHGIPRRVDRLKALGNAVVPQIPEIIGLMILEIEGEP